MTKERKSDPKKLEEKIQKYRSKGNKNLSHLFRLLFFFILIILLFYFFDAPQQTNQLTWLEFKREYLEKHNVEHLAVINKEKVEVYLKKPAQKPDSTDFSLTDNTGPQHYFTIGSVETFERKLDEAQAGFSEDELVGVTYVNRSNWFAELLPWLIPLFLLFLFWMFIRSRMQGMGSSNPLFSIGKSKAKVYDQENRPSVSFKDVAGLDEAKVEIREVVSFLRDRGNYTKLGAKIPKGVLLVGPPGTGKTLLARAVAGEASVPFFSLSGSDFVEMFVGVGASRVRNLFQEAKKKAPCIIFIDEIDAIGRKRGNRKSMYGNDEQENTLNQLLQELDGFEPNAGVIVMAATNREDVLDKALLRPGRFDRRIHLDLPNKYERQAIFNIHIKPLKIQEDIDTDMLASQSAGFSGADIANVCNEAALIAARNQRDSVKQEDFLNAMERIVGGLEKKSKVISKEEKKVIAYHEAGHAIVSSLLKHVDTLVKVSIIPRGRSLGTNWYLPKERHIYTETQLFDRMCAALGGRAAEEIQFGEVSSGAVDDLEKVTKLAYTMVSMYGLNKKLGNISFHDTTGEWNRQFQKPYSEHTGKIIDQEVHELIDKAYEKAKALLKEHEDQLDALSQRLLEKEVLYKNDLEDILKREAVFTEYADTQSYKNRQRGQDL